MISAHGVKEPLGGGTARIGMPRYPRQSHADGPTTEQGQDPGIVAQADPTEVFPPGPIKPLVEPVFNAPVIPFEFQQGCSRKLRRRQIGQQIDLLRLFLAL